MITIIDYKSGNLKSISNGFKKIGVEYQITDDKDVIADSDYLVLPGVGAFGSAMENLESFKDVIYEHVGANKPFLGICLGQQVLMSSSEETPGIMGLDLFKGNVEKLPEGVKIPHMGWNKLDVCNDSPILEGIDKEFFYFVDVVASLSQNNLFSTQFHPEKSGKAGLKILKNFTNLEI